MSSSPHHRRACASLIAAPVAAFVLCLASGAARAGDPALGKTKAQMCAVCHGPLGIATAPETPNLAGQPANYLIQQLRHFKEGLRKHEVMNVMARMLAAEDIDNLAAWFASIQVEAREP